MKVDRDLFLQDLAGLIEIPSISQESEYVKKALEYVIDLAKKRGLKGYTILGGIVGIIEMGRGEETIGVLVHVDVVPAGNGEEWKYNPYKLSVENDILYGRGVADDKGPVIAMLHVLMALKEFERNMKKRIQIIIGTQEEVEWNDIKAYIKSYTPPDFGFTPDGEFPITNIEKGYVDIEVEFNLEDDFVKNLYAGTSTNSIPDIAEMEIKTNICNQLKFKDEYVDTLFYENNLLIKVKTLSAHSSKPMKGINAIWELCRFINENAIDCGDFRRVVDFIMNESYMDYYGSNFRFNKTNETLNGQNIGKTVISPTTMKLAEDGKVIINFNIRQTLGVDFERINEEFFLKADLYSFNFEIKEYMDFLYVDKESPFMKIMADAYERISGMKNEFILAHGTSYAKAMKNFVAWGPYFPGEEDSCHEVNEHIAFDTLICAAKIYKEALYNMALSTESLIK